MRGAGWVSIAIAAGVAMAAPGVAVASDFDDGKDLERRLPMVAIVEGAWSTTLTTGLLATGRLLSPPIDSGLLDLVATRVLYGTSFSVTLVMVGAFTEMAAGGWGWLERAEYKTSWLVSHDVPAGCTSLGAPGGCGLGLGTSSEVRGMWEVRPVGLGLTMGAEWIQGRVDRDSVRTLVESSWVLSPIGLRVELPLGGDDVRLTPGASLGVYGGMHNAHLHAESDIDFEVTDSIFEIETLDGGVGPGASADLALQLGSVLRLEGGIAVSPLVLGGGRGSPVPYAEVLFDDEPGSTVTWRRATAALMARPPGFPFWFGARYWTGELSRRHLTELGHRAVSVAFEVPLRE